MCICWHHFSFISRHIWCSFTPLSISTSVTTSTTPTHHFTTHIQAPLSQFIVRSFCASDKYCTMLYAIYHIPYRYVTVTQLNRFNNSDWSLLSYVFIEWQTKKNFWYIECFQSIVVTRTEQHRQKEIQFVCVAGYFTRRSIITIDMAERKNHKMVYWERKNRVHIAESSMIEKRGAQMENWFDIVWHRKKTIQSRIHSFVM